MNFFRLLKKNKYWMIVFGLIGLIYGVFRVYGDIRSLIASEIRPEFTFTINGLTSYPAFLYLGKNILIVAIICTVIGFLFGLLWPYIVNCYWKLKKIKPFNLYKKQKIWLKISIVGLVFSFISYVLGCILYILDIIRWDWNITLMSFVSLFIHKFLIILISFVIVALIVQIIVNYRVNMDYIVSNLTIAISSFIMFLVLSSVFYSNIMRRSPPTMMYLGSEIPAMIGSLIVSLFLCIVYFFIFSGISYFFINKEYKQYFLIALILIFGILYFSYFIIFSETCEFRKYSIGHQNYIVCISDEAYAQKKIELCKNIYDKYEYALCNNKMAIFYLNKSLCKGEQPLLEKCISEIEVRLLSKEHNYTYIDTCGNGLCDDYELLNNCEIDCNSSKTHIFEFCAEKGWNAIQGVSVVGTDIKVSSDEFIKSNNCFKIREVKQPIFKVDISGAPTGSVCHYIFNTYYIDNKITNCNESLAKVQSYSHLYYPYNYTRIHVLEKVKIH